MPKYLIRKLVICAAALFLIAGFLLVDSSAQKSRRRHKRSSPRITNPAIYQPTPDANANSSGDANTSDANAGDTQPARPAIDEDPQAMKKTIHTLPTQVDKLTDKISQMEESQKSLVDLERLSRAEQRSSALHSELRDVQAKEADLEARAEDIVSMQIFVTDVDEYNERREEVGAAWRRHFGSHYPAAGLFGVTRLVDPAAKVELMAIAVVPGGGESP